MGKEKFAFVFLKDPENAWIPAKLIKSSGNTAEVQIPQYKDEQATICDGGKSASKWIEAEVDLTDYNKGVLPMQNVDEHGNMQSFQDMVELPFLHEVSFLFIKCSLVWILCCLSALLSIPEDQSFGYDIYVLRLT
jgi:hypothetical protein